MTNLHAALERFPRPVRGVLDWALLATPEALSTSLTAARREEVALLVRAAERRWAVARGCLDAENDGPALALMREALRLFILAFLVEHSEAELPVVGHPAALWPRFVECARHLGAELASESEVRALRDFVIADDPALPERLDREARLVLRDQAERTCTWIRSRIEPRSVRWIRLVRYARLAAVALALVVAIVLVLRKALAPVNLARNAPVRSSSMFPGTPAPAALTNGVLEGAYGAHTTTEEEPWFEVDLGTPVTVKRVVVYGRGDGYERESLPVQLEISNDGLVYRTAAEQKSPFTRDEPWTASISEQTRFIRIKKPTRGYLALTEIEVYRR